jgi:hypothetical protein
MLTLTMGSTGYVKLLYFIDHNMRDEKYFYLTRDKKCYVMLYAAGTLK